MDRNRVSAGRAKLARMARRLNARTPGCPVAGLVLMTDDHVAADWEAAVRALPSGAGIIVRSRDATLRAQLAGRLRAVCRARRVRLLVSDDVGLALRTGADGVHFPERSMLASAGAHRLNSRWILSASVHGARGIAQARALPIDILLASPFMPTQSHPGVRVHDVTRLALMIAGARQPVLALGGINPDTVGQLGALSVAGFGLIRGWVPDAPG